MSERLIQAQVLLKVGGMPRCRLWRNNVGMAKDPKTKQHVFFGLVKGAADLVGMAHGYFLAIECKAKDGRVSREQRNFREAVLECGGIHLYAREGTDSADGIATRVLEEVALRRA